MANSPVTLPEPQRIADDVWAVAAPIPEGGPPFTLTYVLLADDGVHLVDAGWDSAENRAALEFSLQALGQSLDRIRTVITTHHHPDHLGIAGYLRESVGATIVLGRTERAVLSHQVRPERRDPTVYGVTLERWGVPAERRVELVRDVTDAPILIVDVEPDLLIDDGTTLELGSHSLTAIATPGHTDGHLCLVDRERQLLYTGDHVLPRINPGIGLGTLGDRDPLEDYLNSLEKLAPFDGMLVLPGHDEPFSDLRARRAGLARHHLRRTRDVFQLLPELGDAPVWDYAARLSWTAGWERLGGFFLRSALSQTEQHLRLARSGRARERVRRAGLDID